MFQLKAKRLHKTFSSAKMMTGSTSSLEEDVISTLQPSHAVENGTDKDNELREVTVDKTDGAEKELDSAQATVEEDKVEPVTETRNEEKNKRTGKKKGKKGQNEKKASETQPLLSNEKDDEDRNALRSVVVDSAEDAVANEVNDEDEIEPVVESQYGATDVREKKGKKGKSGQKVVADALKTDMAAERTFFKWLWTGLHTGAIGSFIFVTFDGNREDPMRMVVVGFSWIVALALVLYGTFAYYRRRRALKMGRLEEIPEWSREHSPLIVVVALVLVVGLALGYALYTGGGKLEGGGANIGGGGYVVAGGGR